MKHTFIFLFIFLLAVEIIAKDNPFDSYTYDTNTNNKFSNVYLKEEKFFLPNLARELRSITFEYVNLDGSIQRKKIDINNAIDWHKPIFIKQNTNALLKKLNTRSVEYIPFRFVKYKIFNKKIEIYTKLNKIRHYYLPNPFRIVVDFSSKYNFMTQTKHLNRMQVSQLSTEAHKGFMRVLIILDAPYKYTVEKTVFGYRINLI